MSLTELKEKQQQAILAGVHTGSGDPLQDTTEESINELERLADTAGAVVVGTLIQNRPSPENATFLGEGKVEELRLACESLQADMVIFDSELSPIQLKNLEKILGLRVIDRSMLILDIFARHALSREGKIQVELAQLRYMLPRLMGIGSQLSRLGAGIGTRGPGETRLETDRRHIRRRIHHLQEELSEVRKHRELLRAGRKNEGAVTVALAGYTNAGKSTLLNALTGADVYAEDKLFATLDPTVRGFTLEDGRNILLIDTVGFIRKLPHHLIEAFKSTLEEITLADVILHVADGSNPEFAQHIQVVSRIVNELGAGDKPVVLAFNKADQTPSENDLPASLPDVNHIVAISAKTGMGFDELLAAIGDVAPGKKKVVTLKIPYAQGSILSELHEKHAIVQENYESDGTLVKVLLDAKAYNQFKSYLIEGDTP
ncbi:MAG: GTPase HflX [Ruminococcaceae bacterium]|nr:GTPase HflX [Oscillospiraceae bacterium]